MMTTSGFRIRDSGFVALGFVAFVRSGFVVTALAGASVSSQYGYSFTGGRRAAARQESQGWCGGGVAANELRAAVDDHLRGVDAFGVEPRSVHLLPVRQRCGREAIFPAEAIPVIDMLTERDHLDATGLRGGRQPLEQRVRRRAA